MKKELNLKNRKKERKGQALLSLEAKPTCLTHFIRAHVLGLLFFLLH